MENTDSQNCETMAYFAHVESSARTYGRAINFVVDRALGTKVYDLKGNVFLDCLAGAGTLATGHNDSRITKVLIEHIQSGGLLHGLDLVTPVKEQFTKSLFEQMPLSLAKDGKVQFCGPSGADAIEAAIKLFKTATGRSTIIAFHGGYHGMTAGALSLTGNLAAKKDVTNLMPGAHFMPYPYTYRCPFGSDGEATVKLSINYLRNVLSDPESGITKPAAIIVEPIQGEGGCIVAPVEWLQQLRQLTRELDIPLVVDEVQCGVGRTGKMFAFEHAGIEPDAIVISKAIGGGMPISLVVYHKDYDKWQPGAHTGTFRGNQLAMAAGIETLNIVQQPKFLAEVTEKGQYFVNALKQTFAEVRQVGDIRGKGLMIGLEMIKPDTVDSNNRPQADGELVGLIKSTALKLGLIIESGGRYGAVLRLLPPLTISFEEIDKVVSILSAATSQAVAQLDEIRHQ